MLPLGHTLYLWRLEKGLTQEELSHLSGISRPNLSAVEQGARDVTVQTARRLARALGIGAGVLVEGVPPRRGEPLSLTREALDRIARYAAGQKLPMPPGEERLAGLFRRVLKSKLASRDRLRGRLPRTARDEDKSLSELKSALSSAEIRNILSRIEKISGVNL